MGEPEAPEGWLWDAAGSFVFLFFRNSNPLPSFELPSGRENVPSAAIIHFWSWSEPLRHEWTVLGFPFSPRVVRPQGVAWTSRDYITPFCLVRSSLNTSSVSTVPKVRHWLERQGNTSSFAAQVAHNVMCRYYHKTDRNRKYNHLSTWTRLFCESNSHKDDKILSVLMKPEIH